MRSTKYLRCTIAVGLVAAISLIGMGMTNVGLAAEGKYPQKTIQIVVGYSPGATDASLRIFTEKMKDYLKQPMVFVYKPGSAGSVGASFVAKAKPDGYTLMGMSQSPVMTTTLTKEVDYTLDDFSPICQVVKSPIVIAVKAESPLKSLKDVVAAAKKSPGSLSYSTSGVFGSTHVPTEVFMKAAGIKLTHVPCAGTAPAVMALLGGHVDMTTSTMSAIIPHLKAGTLRAIAVFEKKRFKELPDVPTCSEQGYPLVFSVDYGLMAPKSTSDEVIRIIDGAAKKTIKEHMNYLEDRTAKMSLVLDYLNPEEFRDKLRAEYKTLKVIIGELNASVK